MNNNSDKNDVILDEKEVTKDSQVLKHIENHQNICKANNSLSSQFRIASGQKVEQKGQAMNYRDNSYGEYPVCSPTCSCQSADTNGEDVNPRVACGEGCLDSASPSSSEMSQNGSYYSYGQSLPELDSASNDTIVNKPMADSPVGCVSPGCSKDSCTYCQKANSGLEQQFNLCQEQQHMMPVPMGVDPRTGLPVFCYSTPVCYSGNAMYSMPDMQIPQSQRGGGGHHNEEIGNQFEASSSSFSENCHSSYQNPSGFDMEALMQKYQQSVQQCYATAQQSLISQNTGSQQSYATGQSQPYFNNFPQRTQQPYSHPKEGTQQMFGSSDNQATQQFYESPNQEYQQVSANQQAFTFPFGSQQYYANSSLGAQQYFPPSMTIPETNFFGNNTGFTSDSLQTQTVYSSDYKPFASEGNHFNHFPNGIDIGLAAESCPIYGPVGTAGLAEMSTGGQVYGMGGVCEMNMNSYPLSQMSYSNPYSYEMPVSQPSYNHATNMAMNGRSPM
ncbi:uncharacterized protein LOC108135522 isoform X2 [Drosophila elegans]|uniref:uncharacterized protein LOC108135522 isoform X2 n=1 Tax=Drosophila elegans TaxID=30023 RepID=UPI0007E7C10F|nr:uncharacterized protein LOC108135522 isoform X2 [Drosophila elegans]